MFKTWNSVERNLTCNHNFGREPILSKENRDTVVCISLNEYIVDMIYNITSNT